MVTNQDKAKAVEVLRKAVATAKDLGITESEAIEAIKKEFEAQRSLLAGPDRDK